MYNIEHLPIIKHFNSCLFDECFTSKTMNFGIEELFWWKGGGNISKIMTHTLCIVFNDFLKLKWYFHFFFFNSVSKLLLFYFLIKRFTNFFYSSICKIGFNLSGAIFKFDSTFQYVNNFAIFFWLVKNNQGVTKKAPLNIDKLCLNIDKLWKIDQLKSNSRCKKYLFLF